MCSEETFPSSVICAVCGKPDIKSYVIVCDDCHARWGAWSSTDRGAGQDVEGDQAVGEVGHVGADVVSAAKGE